MRIARLVAAAGSWCDAARADEDTLAEIRGIGRRLAAQIARGRAAVDVDAELRRADAAGARIVTWLDREYPDRLRGLRDAPPVLYLRGAWRGGLGSAVAIVGTRRPSPYGVDVTRGLARAVAEAGATVISGLARGVDHAAHDAALRAGGATVGVLPCGVDVFYPPEHAILMEAMCARGGLLSEVPIGVRPERRRFPLRNRLISALAEAVVVIEGGEESGAMITARHAAAQRRPLYAVPGSVFAPGSRAPHALLAAGAGVVRDPRDVLRRLGLSGPSRSALEGDGSLAGLDADEAGVWEALDAGAETVDAIIDRTALPPARVASALATLEIRGLVRRSAGNRVARRMTFAAADAPEAGGGDSWPNHWLS